MAENIIGSSTPVTAAQIYEGMDLESMMMAVQSARASNLEVQLKGQLMGVADRNTQISDLNQFMTELRTLRPSGSDPDKWGNLDSNPAESKVVYDKIRAVGLTIPGGEPSNLPDNFMYAAQQKTFDIWSEQIKGKIDGLSSTQQMDMLRLQSLSNKRNEAFELMTNFIKKFYDAIQGIIGNLR